MGRRSHSQRRLKSPAVVMAFQGMPLSPLHTLPTTCAFFRRGLCLLLAWDGMGWDGMGWDGMEQGWVSQPKPIWWGPALRLAPGSLPSSAAPSSSSAPVAALQWEGLCRVPC